MSLHRIPAWCRNRLSDLLGETRTAGKDRKLAAEVVSRWREQRMGRHVTLIMHYSFLSAFPALLVLTATGTLLSRALGWDTAAIEASMLGRVPLIGDQVRVQAGSLRGDILTVTTGLLVAAWAATRALTAIFEMNDDSWLTPPEHRSGYARRRARCLRALVVLGSGAAAASAISVVALASLPLPAEALALVVALGVNVFVVRGLLCLGSQVPVTGRRLPGVPAGGILFTVLQLVGGGLVGTLLANRQGPFAPTFALFGWLGVHAVVLSAASIVNAVAHDRRSDH